MDLFLFKPPGKQVATLISINLKPLKPGISSCLNKNGTNSYVFQAGADFCEVSVVLLGFSVPFQLDPSAVLLGPQGQRQRCRELALAAGCLKITRGMTDPSLEIQGHLLRFGMTGGPKKYN